MEFKNVKLTIKSLTYFQGKSSKSPNLNQKTNESSTLRHGVTQKTLTSHHGHVLIEEISTWLAKLHFSMDEIVLYLDKVCQAT